MPSDTAATIVLLGWMVWAGYLGPIGRPFSWPMYSYGELVAVDLVDGNGSYVSIFDVRCAGEFGIPMNEFVDILKFMELSGVETRGEGLVLGPYGERQVKVEASRVVVGKSPDEFREPDL